MIKRVRVPLSCVKRHLFRKKKRFVRAQKNPTMTSGAKQPFIRNFLRHANARGTAALGSGQTLLSLINFTVVLQNFQLCHSS
ncbi:MAG: hypothetical protein ABI870_09145 [Rhodanobacter sp.]